ncbi:MAG: hypothetical protein ACKOX3_06390 [Bacteroidota bacterium]
MNIVNNRHIRGKNGDTYPPFLWIISSFLGIIGGYFSQFGAIYHKTGHALLWISGWCLILGVYILWMSLYDQPSPTTTEKTGVYSIVNHPKKLGEYLLLMGINLQSLNIFTISLNIIVFSLYHKWLLQPNWQSLLTYESFFKFKLKGFKESQQKQSYLSTLQKLKTRMIILFFLLIFIVELRYRSIGRSFYDYF